MKEITLHEKLEAVNAFFKGNDFIIDNDDRIYCKFENEHLDEDELDDIIEMCGIQLSKE